MLQVTLIARGDVPLSIVMTMCSTLGAVVLTPLLTLHLAGTYVPIDAVKLSISTLQGKKVGEKKRKRNHLPRYYFLLSGDRNAEKAKAAIVKPCSCFYAFLYDMLKPLTLKKQTY